MLVRYLPILDNHSCCGCLFGFDCYSDWNGDTICLFVPTGAPVSTINSTISMCSLSSASSSAAASVQDSSGSIVSISLIVSSSSAIGSVPDGRFWKAARSRPLFPSGLDHSIHVTRIFCTDFETLPPPCGIDNAAILLLWKKEFQGSNVLCVETDLYRSFESRY
jgi:hypothetical protein